MALGTELFQLATSYDPYGAFKEGMREPKEQELKDIAVDEQLKEAKQDQADNLAQMATPGKSSPVPLAQMSASVLGPQYKMQTQDGQPTVASEANAFALKAAQEQKNMISAAKRAKTAKIMGDAKAEENAMAELRRADGAYTSAQKEVKNIQQNAIDDAVYSAIFANGQGDYEKRIQSGLDRTGMPKPSWLPDQWSPELKDTLISRASPAMQEKINNRIDKQEQRAESEKRLDMAVSRFAAASRNGNAGGARSALIEQRQDTLTVNATEFVRTLGNIKDLPADSSSGLFGGKSTNSLFTAPANAATNKLTTDSVQRYNSEMGGLGNHLAWMVSGGYVPAAGVQEKFDDILKIKEGDSQATVLTKLARARQEAENVLKVKQKSRLVSPEMKEMLSGLQQDLENTIPYTVSDVNKWANKKDGKETFSQFIGKSGVVSGEGSSQPSGGSLPPGFKPL
jgi:hypothetical protein